MKWITEVMEDNARKMQKEAIKNFQLKTMSTENISNHQIRTNDFEVPRRIRVDLFTPAEKAIWDAAKEVEKAGCDVLLTDALNLLHAAREKVADFVDKTI